MTDGVDHAGDFMARNAGVLEAGPMPLLHECVAMADATGFDADADFSGTGIGDVSLDDLEVTTGAAELNGSHSLILPAD